jgi:uncharacterized repeat protein (TIGR02543 family)
LPPPLQRETLETAVPGNISHKYPYKEGHGMKKKLVLWAIAALVFTGCEDYLSGKNEPAPSRYTITFDSRGGSALQPISGDEGSAVPKPADPEKTGCTFLGWFSAAEGGIPYAWPHTLTGDVTMYAHWQDGSEPGLSRFTITFDSRGGSALQPISGDEGSAVPKPADPAKTGCTFLGWFSAAEGGTLYAWPHTLTANVTMYAHWQDGSEPGLSQYTITFDSRGGLALQPISGEEGLEVPKPADPVKTGCIFLGWYSAAEGGTLYAWPHTLTGYVFMYARWQSTITFDSRGGLALQPISGEEGLEVPKPADPTRTGYTFLGWHSAAEGGTLYAWPHTLTGYVTMYAHWSLDFNNQTVTLTIDNLTDPAQGAFSDTAFILTRPNGTKTITVTDNGTDIKWYVGLVKIAEGNSVTLDLAVLKLSPGPHTLRVTAKYSGVLYSKEITFTVNE